MRKVYSIEGNHNQRLIFYKFGLLFIEIFRFNKGLIESKAFEQKNKKISTFS